MNGVVQGGQAPPRQVARGSSAFERLVLGLPLLVGAALVLPVLLVAGGLLVVRTVVRWRPPWFVALLVPGIFLGCWMWRLQAQGTTLEGLTAQYLAAHLGLLGELRRVALGGATGGVWAWPAALDGGWLRGYTQAVGPLAVPAGVVLATAVHLLAGRRKTGGPLALQKREEAPVVFPKAVVRRADAGKITYPGDGVAVGWTDTGELVALRGRLLHAHALIAGMTGLGKTTLMKHLIAALYRRHPLLVVDFKGSVDLEAFVRAIPGSAVWRIGGEVRWDPLQGSVSTLAAKLVAVAGTVTGEQQNKATLGVLQLVAAATVAAGERRDLARLSGLLDLRRFRAYLAEHVAPRDPVLAEQLAAEVAKAEGERGTAEAIQGLDSRLRTVAYGDAAQSLGEGAGCLDIEAAIRAGRTVLFSVPVPQYGVLAQTIGAFLLVELKRVSDALQRSGWGTAGNLCPVLIDEFSAMEAQGRHAVDLLQRARESGLAVWLFTQGLRDLAKVGPDAAEQILGNTSIHGVFRQQAPSDLEGWAEQFGSFEEELLTRSIDEQGHRTGRASVRWRKSYYVSGHRLQQLPLGAMYLRRPAPGRAPPRLDAVLVATAPSAPLAPTVVARSLVARRATDTEPEAAPVVTTSVTAVSAGAAAPATPREPPDDAAHEAAGAESHEVARPDPLAHFFPVGESHESSGRAS